jgi:hypothetical protein
MFREGVGASGVGRPQGLHVKASGLSFAGTDIVAESQFETRAKVYG